LVLECDGRSADGVRLLECVGSAAAAFRGQCSDGYGPKQQSCKGAARECDGGHFQPQGLAAAG